jgi:hypothetical protein
MATAHVVLPSGQRGIHRTEGEQPSAARSALVRQPLIHAGEVAMEDALEAAGPGLGDAVLGHLLQQRGGLVEGQAAERPVEKADVRIHGLESVRDGRGRCLRRRRGRGVQDGAGGERGLEEIAALHVGVSGRR